MRGPEGPPIGRPFGVNGKESSNRGGIRGDSKVDKAAEVSHVIVIFERKDT